METTVASGMPHNRLDHPPMRFTERLDAPHRPALETFARELQPAIRTSERITVLERVMNEYKTGLNDAMFNKNLTKEEKGKARDVAGAEQFLNPLYSEERRHIALEEKQINAQVVYGWFDKNYGGVTALLQEYLDQTGKNAALSQELQAIVGENMSYWIRFAGANEQIRAEYHKMQLDNMRRFLLQHVVLKDAAVLRYLARQKGTEDAFATPLADSLQVKDWLQSEDLEKEVNALKQSATVDEHVYRLDHEVQTFEVLDWLKTMAVEARKGRKIYDTPYYAKAIEDLHFLGRKKNGVGGVIVYGPPGTGKTEIVQEKNRQEGYKTRVISIHHYTSFAELLAERPLEAGKDHSAEIAQKVESIYNTLKDDSPEQFSDYFLEMVLQLKTEGKMSAQNMLFLSNFASFETDLFSKDKLSIGDVTRKNLLEMKGKLSKEEWTSLRDRFLTMQKARLLRTALPSFLQETSEDVVKGEILLAMLNGQRALLDEIDKAGPNSMGGILSFLAKSPGVDYFEFGQAQFPIPRWFKIDATSNSTVLDPWLVDRFSGMQLETPPIADQLMIAAVRLSNDKGKLMLSEQEQSQFSAFFVYVVPEVNRILQGMKNASISNRSIQELTSYLVDFTNGERTNVSVEEAVKLLLLQNKMWAANETITSELETLLQRYSGILHAPTKEEDAEKELKLTKLPVLERISKLQQLRDKNLGETLSSPMIQVFTHLPKKERFFRKPKASAIELSDRQKRAVALFIEREETARQDFGDIKRLSTGFTVYEKSTDEGSEVANLVLYAHGSDKELSSTRLNSKRGKIAAASADGTSVLLTVPAEKGDRMGVTRIRAFDPKPESNEKAIVGGLAANSHVAISEDGKAIGYLAGDTVTTLRIVSDTGVALMPDENNVEHFAFGTDSKVVVVNKKEKMLLVALDDTEIKQFPGSGWRFVDNNLLVNRVGGDVTSQAYLVA